MLLVIDVGNTQTVFGVFEGDRITRHWRLSTARARTADEYAAFLFPHLLATGIEAHAFQGVVLCSVVPSVEPELERFSTQYLAQAAFRIHSGIALGFQLHVETPEQVGADRLANAAYAAHWLKLPAVVVDFGTATKLELVTPKKDYQGGIILPGLRLMADSLATGTAKLPHVELRFPTKAIGKNTVECLQSGILFGYCDLVEGLMCRVEKEVGEACEIVLTGGFASLLQPGLSRKLRLIPDLTLQGSALLYRLNHST